MVVDLRWGIGVRDEGGISRMPIRDGAEGAGGLRRRGHVRLGVGREAGEHGGGGSDGGVDGVEVVHLVAIIIAGLVDFLQAAGAAAAAREVVGSGVVVPALERDGAGVEAVVFDGDDLLVALVADDDAGAAPGEVVLVPEGVDGQDEGVDGEGDDVDDHPADMLPLAFDDEDDGLQAVHGGDHDDGYERELAGVGGDPVDQVTQICTSGG